MKILLILLILLILIFVVSNSSSNFEEYSCNLKTSEDIKEVSMRTFPSGNVSGNYLSLNEFEKNKLLVNFVNNQ